MVESDDESERRVIWKWGRCVVSFVTVFLSQFALFMLPCFFPNSSLFILLCFSAIVTLAVAGFGRCCKRLLGFRASAPAFVFFNILFIWGVYIAVIRPVISLLVDIVFNAEIVLLVIGLYSIVSSDPGYITYGSSCLDDVVDGTITDVEAYSESPVSAWRIRYCRHCKAYVKGFDHHCPAFGNCIGQENHVLFIILLIGFVTAEASYVLCSSQFATKSQIFDISRWETSKKLAISTMLFSLLQMLWQGVFLTWHIYCVCFNIRTDEWINWKRYPEFQLINQSQPGETINHMRFRNPYDKGILCNIKEFLAP
ncbi:uncharacterized protein LOC132269453 isoform X2 [Cornus florida]|uniref:uncharacterized protein LOC132269453 isoform X2 n=1 Tax=Cornus florida TaxID=4283 RepID=UPI00289808C6|nr:uncharacterized protein LOC132269453 isoform X2 [Cornus florida]